MNALNVRLTWLGQLFDTIIVIADASQIACLNTRPIRPTGQRGDAVLQTSDQKEEVAATISRVGWVQPEWQPDLDPIVQNIGARRLHTVMEKLLWSDISQLLMPGPVRS